MSDIVLFRRDDLEVSALVEAKEMLDQAIGISSLIGKVTKPDEQQAAVAAQLLLKQYLNTVEKSRKFVKQPVWELCITIDTLAKELSEQAKSELMRISTLVGYYQAAELARARAAEAMRLRDLEESERKRQTELAKAQTLEQADAINEAFNALNAALPVASPPKVTGQRITEDWEITVTDAWLLARSHPSCVDIKPRIGEIKALVKAGVKVQGVIATPITRADVRLPQHKAIDV